MAYTIYKANGNPINIEDTQINQEFYSPDVNGPSKGLGIQLVGRNITNYGAPIAQNILQLTENFCGKNLPNDSISLQGQLWFNAISSNDGDLYIKSKNNTSIGLENWKKLLIPKNESSVGQLLSVDADNKVNWVNKINWKTVSANYIIDTNDAVFGGIIINSTLSVNITVPQDFLANIPVGTSITLLSVNTGLVNVISNSNVKILIKTPKQPTLVGKFSVATITKIYENEWTLNGDLISSLVPPPPPTPTPTPTPTPAPTSLIVPTFNEKTYTVTDLSNSTSSIALRWLVNGTWELYSGYQDPIVSSPLNSPTTGIWTIQPDPSKYEGRLISVNVLSSVGNVTYGPLGPGPSDWTPLNTDQFITNAQCLSGPSSILCVFSFEVREIANPSNKISFTLTTGAYSSAPTPSPTPIPPTPTPTPPAPTPTPPAPTPTPPSVLIKPSYDKLTYYASSSSNTGTVRLRLYLNGQWSIVTTTFIEGGPKSGEWKIPGATGSFEYSITEIIVISSQGQSSFTPTTPTNYIPITDGISIVSVFGNNFGIESYLNVTFKISVRDANNISEKMDSEITLDLSIYGSGGPLV